MSERDDAHDDDTQKRTHKTKVYVGSTRQVLSRLLWIAENCDIKGLRVHPASTSAPKAGWVYDGEEIECESGQIIEGTGKRPPKSAGRYGRKKAPPGRYTKKEWIAKQTRDRGREFRAKQREEKYQQLLRDDPVAAEAYRRRSQSARRGAARRALEKQKQAAEKDKK